VNFDFGFHFPMQNRLKMEVRQVFRRRFASVIIESPFCPLIPVRPGFGRNASSSGRSSSLVLRLIRSMNKMPFK